MRFQRLLILVGGLILCAGARASDGAAAAHWKQNEFIITFWCPPPATDKLLSQVKAEGYNLTWVPAEGLDAAARHHLKAMLMSDLLKPETLDEPVKRAALDSLIEKVKNHPALEAYYITDEPGAGAFPGLGRLVAYLRERDPAHLAYINLFPTYATGEQLEVSADAAERARAGYPLNFAGVGTDDQTVLRYQQHLRKFVETVKPDLLSYDHYHFLKPNEQGRLSDGKQYFLNLGLIRLESLEAGIPFLNIIQAGSGEKWWRQPTPSEMRWLVFTTVAYGGRGVSYFTYWGFPGGLYVAEKPSSLVQPIAELNQELAMLGPALLNLNSKGVYHTAPLPYGGESVPASSPVQFVGPGKFVLGLFSQPDKSTAFMVVNRDYGQPSEAVLRVNFAGTRIRELDRKTGRWSDGPALGRDKTVRINLQAGDGRLFRLEKAPVLVAPHELD